MAEIKLLHGYNVLVDDDDLDRASQFIWYVNKSGGGSLVVRNYGTPYMNMARLVMNCPIDKQVDHINGDTLDNRKINLRICSHGENMRNRKTHRNKNPTTKYKGVYLTKARGYRATIQINGKRINSKTYFKTPEEAASAYNHLALIHHGVFAKLNEIT